MIMSKNLFFFFSILIAPVISQENINNIAAAGGAVTGGIQFPQNFVNPFPTNPTYPPCSRSCPDPCRNCRGKCETKEDIQFSSRLGGGGVCRKCPTLEKCSLPIGGGPIGTACPPPPPCAYPQCPTCKPGFECVEYTETFFHNGRECPLCPKKECKKKSDVIVITDCPIPACAFPSCPPKCEPGFECVEETSTFISNGRTCPGCPIKKCKKKTCSTAKCRDPCADCDFYGGECTVDTPFNRATGCSGCSTLLSCIVPH